MSDRDVVIVGGGLCGSLLAALLARRGFPVELCEARTDPRSREAESGRSINLILTARGIEALRRVGLDRGAFELTVPVWGRMVHSPEGELAYQPYGKDESECNYSIPRGGLNRFLLDAAEREGVRLSFGTRLVDADPRRGSVELEGPNGRERREGTIFGADGAGSALRQAMTRLDGFEESVEMLEHGYKELEIPAGPDDTFRIDGRALHIWPRGSLMLMALPNLDGSFTVTLYLPMKGPESFEEVSTQERVRELFERHFADSIPLMPDLDADYRANPTGELGTVRMAPWCAGGRSLLVGDAAHAIVPFFGQGMNCAFEDCTVLDDLLESHGGDWPTVFRAFDRRRKPNADAIADMALENFVEMRDRVGDDAFLLRKRVENALESDPENGFRSRYSMVVYSLIPYRIAQQAGEIQRGILDELCVGLERPEEVDRERARGLIRERLTPFLERHGVSLDY